MKTKVVVLINIFLSVLVLVFGLQSRSAFPDPMAVHWGASGQADGYGSVFTGVWLIPLMVVGLTFLLAAIPYIDPLRENIKKFSGEYNLFILIFAIYMLYVQMLSLAYNLGWISNLNPYFIPAMGILMIFVGQLIGKAHRNYFIGIRTPWTLQDERVWNETHKRAGLIFKISGAISLLGIFFPNYAIWILLVPILFAAFYSIVLSYVLYQKYNPKPN
ncbi:MAG: SdpI family protein [Anaerolineaceae bacterium]